jgi:hypothetical protein
VYYRTVQASADDILRASQTWPFQQSLEVGRSHDMRLLLRFDMRQRKAKGRRLMYKVTKIRLELPYWTMWVLHLMRTAVSELQIIQSPLFEFC